MGRSYKQWAQPALAAGWIAWSGGCATTGSTNGPPQIAQTTPSPTRQAQPQQQILPQTPQPTPPQTTVEPRFILAPELKSILDVVSVRLIKPQAGSFLKIQVNVQNKTDLPQNFHYRLEWFDQDGVPLQLGEKEFVPWMLLPHETSSIAQTAPAMSAVDFEIAFVP